MELMGALGSPGCLSRAQSQPRGDEWLCARAERKPKPRGSKRRSLYRHWKINLSRRLWVSAWHTHFCTNTPIILPEETLTGKTIFPPNNFLVWFFLCLFDGVLLSEIRGKSEWSWVVSTCCSYFMFYKTASEQIPLAERSPSRLGVVKNFKIDINYIQTSGNLS